jgi:formate dehydrogenase subunit delta
MSEAHGKAEKLVRMAGEIADFFGPYPEAEAVKGIHEHIRSFWTPAMRAELRSFVEAGGAVPPRVAAAMRRFPADPAPVGAQVVRGEDTGRPTRGAG